MKTINGADCNPENQQTLNLKPVVEELKNVFDGFMYVFLFLKSQQAAVYYTESSHIPNSTRKSAKINLS